MQKNAGRLRGLRGIEGENLNHSMLVKAVAKSSGYKPYEVEDVLWHLVKVIQSTLRDKGTVKINGLGTIAPRIYGAKTWWDSVRQKKFSSEESITVQLRADSVIRGVLNREEN